MRNNVGWLTNVCWRTNVRCPTNVRYLTTAPSCYVRSLTNECWLTNEGHLIQESMIISFREGSSWTRSVDSGVGSWLVIPSGLVGWELWRCCLGDCDVTAGVTSSLSSWSEQGLLSDGALRMGREEGNRRSSKSFVFESSRHISSVQDKSGPWTLGVREAIITSFSRVVRRSMLVGETSSRYEMASTSFPK